MGKALNKAVATRIVTKSVLDWGLGGGLGMHIVATNVMLKHVPVLRNMYNVSAVALGMFAAVNLAEKFDDAGAAVAEFLFPEENPYGSLIEERGS